MMLSEDSSIELSLGSHAASNTLYKGDDIRNDDSDEDAVVFAAKSNSNASFGDRSRNIVRNTSPFKRCKSNCESSVCNAIEIVRICAYEKLTKGRKMLSPLPLMKQLTTIRSKSLAEVYYTSACRAADLMVGSFFKSIGWTKRGKSFEEILENPEGITFFWLPMNHLRKFYETHSLMIQKGKIIVNHLPKSYKITNKICLAKRLSAKKSQFLPESHFFSPDDSRRLLSYKPKFVHSDKLWIAKRGALSQGQGILIIREEEDLEVIASNMGRRGWIIQKYVDRPLLLKKRKFDMRVFLLVASTKPVVTFYHSGYARLCCQAYTKQSSSNAVHLTNQAVQKTDPLFSSMRNDSTWSIQAINKNLNQYKKAPHDWALTVLQRKIRQILQELVDELRDDLVHCKGCFELFGCDIMIDADLNVWLLEANSEPTLNKETSLKRYLIPSITNEALAIVLECFYKRIRGLPIMPLTSQMAFQTLSDESLPFEKTEKKPKKKRYQIHRQKIVKNTSSATNSTSVQAATGTTATTATSETSQFLYPPNMDGSRPSAQETRPLRRNSPVRRRSSSKSSKTKSKSANGNTNTKRPR